MKTSKNIFIEIFRILKYLIKVFIEDKKYKKKISKIKLSKKSNEALKSLKKKGYYVWKNYYSLDECNDIKDEVSRLIEKGEHLKTYGDADFRVYPGQSLSEKINLFNKQENILEIANSFLKMDSIAFFTLAAKLIDQKGNEGSGQGWHRDTYRPYQFKAMIYLTDVSEVNGPFQMLENTNSISSLFDLHKRYGTKYDQNRFNKKEIDAFSDKRSIRTFTGKAGDLILFNSFTIHRGKPIKSGTRYALTSYFFPKHYINKYKEIVINKFDLVR